MWPAFEECQVWLRQLREYVSRPRRMTMEEQLAEGPLQWDNPGNWPTAADEQLRSDAIASGRYAMAPEIADTSRYRMAMIQAGGDPAAPTINPKLVAERLMQKVLPEDVYLSMSALQYADVPGQLMVHDTGKPRMYRLFRGGRKTEITDPNGHVWSACIYLPGQQPDTDRIVAEYLLIVNDEAEYLETANLTVIHGLNGRHGMVGTDGIAGTGISVLSSTGYYDPHPAIAGWDARAVDALIMQNGTATAQMNALENAYGRTAAVRNTGLLRNMLPPPEGV